MSLNNKKNTVRKMPPKKIKDNVNTALKTVTKPEDAFSKADSIIRSGSPVPPPVAKELLSNFYDLVLCKYEAHEPPPKNEEITPETAEARFAKPRPSLKKKPASSGLLPIPCTSDICSKVRQLVQMNNKVQNFKKKFLEVPSDIVDEKRAMQQRKFKIGNEYSKRNASKKNASEIGKNKKTANEDGCGCEAPKKVTWGSDSEKPGNQSNDLEKNCSLANFADCLDDDCCSFSPDCFSDGFQHDFRKEKHYETDYASCVETDCPNSSRTSSKTRIRENSSARMLIHFRELLSMHVLPKNANDINCSFLSDEDIAFLQTLVEADERYHCLKKEDHNLLKDILRIQLKQIETQERILAETLTKLRQKSGSSEDISVNLNVPNKEKAEQPLEMSEKKDPPYEVILRDLLKMPEETLNFPDKESSKSLKTSKSTEDASKDLENRLLNQQVQIAEDELNDFSFHSLPPLISYPPSPSESPRYPRRCEETSVKITEAKTELYEDSEVVVPPLDLDKINTEPIRFFNLFSARESKERNKKNTSSQKKARAVSARLEKTKTSEKIYKRSSSARNKSEDTQQFQIFIEKKKKGEINEKDMCYPKVVGDNQSQNPQHVTTLFSSAPLHEKMCETYFDDLKQDIPGLDINAAKKLVDCEIIKSTAKLISEVISQSSKVAKINRPSRDQETNTIVSSIKCEYFTISFEYMMFLENLATIEVCPLFVTSQRHIAKEFRMKYIPIDELSNAGEFFILNSGSPEITIEKTNFQTLHKQPEKLSKLLQPMYKQPVDEAVSEDDSNYTFLYPWQLSDYSVSEDMLQNVICCLFKTWATHPELYKQSISNCKSMVPLQIKSPSKGNKEHGKYNSAVLENKPEIGEHFEVNNQQNIAKNELSENNDTRRHKIKKHMTAKNLLVFTAQFLLFTALVLGLSLFQYKCLDM